MASSVIAEDIKLLKDWSEKLAKGPSSFAAEERKLITDRLKELDTLENEQNLFFKEQEMKKTGLSDKKVGIQEMIDDIQSHIEESLAKKTSLLEQQTKKEDDLDQVVQSLEGKKSERREKMTDLEQKIKVEAKKPCFSTQHVISECTVCMESIIPPKQIFHCMEGHLICNCCRDQLPSPNNCPTCRVNGSFSRCRALEDHHKEVTDYQKLSFSERIAALSLSVTKIDSLIEEIENHINEVDLIDMEILQTRESFQEDPVVCKLYEDISAVESLLETLMSQKLDLVTILNGLECGLADMEQDFNSKMAAMMQQQDKNKIVKKQELNDLKSTVEAYVMSCAKDPKTHVEPLLKYLDYKEGEHFIWATHFVTFHMKLEGSGEYIPAVKIFLAGKESPRTVQKFLNLCKSHYKGSRIQAVTYGSSIEGGARNSSNEVFRNTVNYTPDTNYSRHFTAGDLVMRHKPTKDTEEFTKFNIHGCDFSYHMDMVRVGKVLDISPNSGVGEMMNKKKQDKIGSGYRHTKLMITDITTDTLPQPVTIPCVVAT